MQSTSDMSGEIPAEPATIVAAILALLHEAEGTDLRLLEILEARIVRMDAGTSAIVEALKDIEGLASERAGAPDDG